MFIMEIKSKIPSLNHMYVQSGRYRKVSSEHRKFKNLIYMSAFAETKALGYSLPLYPSGQLKLTIDAYFKRRGRDIDNIVKPIQDSLHNVFFHKDSQVYALHVTKKSETEKEEKIVIKIQRLD